MAGTSKGRQRRGREGSLEPSTHTKNRGQGGFGRRVQGTAVESHADSRRYVFANRSSLQAGQGARHCHRADPGARRQPLPCRYAVVAVGGGRAVAVPKGLCQPASFTDEQTHKLPVLARRDVRSRSCPCRPRRWAPLHLGRRCRARGERHPGPLRRARESALSCRSALPAFAAPSSWVPFTSGLSRILKVHQVCAHSVGGWMRAAPKVPTRKACRAAATSFVFRSRLDAAAGSSAPSARRTALSLRPLRRSSSRAVTS